jgi:hypothetical protein
MAVVAQNVKHGADLTPGTVGCGQRSANFAPRRRWRAYLRDFGASVAFD